MCKSYCVLPWDVAFCANDTQVTVKAKICNASTFTQTYMYWCGASSPGPARFHDRWSDFVHTVHGHGHRSPRKLLSVSTVVARPVGMTALGLVGCLQLDVQSLGNQLVHKFHCSGSVQDRRDICVTFPYDSLTMTAGSPGQVAGILVANTGGVAINRNYEFVVMDNASMALDTSAVSLNGLPPGTPAPGLSSSGRRIHQSQPHGRVRRDSTLGKYTLLMRDDWNGDTIFDPLASMTLECPLSTAGVVTVGSGCAFGGTPVQA